MAVNKYPGFSPITTLEPDTVESVTPACEQELLTFLARSDS
jgi:hypothetical protein